MIVNFLQTVLAFVLVLAPLVFIHELGHFLAAKSFGVGVPVFSLGFGPRVFGFRRRETDYRISLIPLGGYVRMTGDESDEHRTGAANEFLARPRWQRFVVYVAGALFNVLLAFVALWVLFGTYGIEEDPRQLPTICYVEAGSAADVAGVQARDVLVRIGDQRLDPSTFVDAYTLEVVLAPNTEKSFVVLRGAKEIEFTLNTGADPTYGWGDPGWYPSLEGCTPAVVEQVTPGDRADQAGFEPGDRILAAAGREPVSETEVRLLLIDAAEKPLEFKVQRGDEVVELTVVPRDEEGRGFIGVGFARPELRRRDVSVGEAARESLKANVNMSKTLFVVLNRLVTRQVSLKTMSGPIGIAQVARRALVAGPEFYLGLLGFFSLQLGILNLLPIPVLDGGHILILGVESVMRRELSDKLKERVMLAGLVFLLLFMSTIIYLDVMKSL